MNVLFDIEPEIDRAISDYGVPGSPVTLLENLFALAIRKLTGKSRDPGMTLDSGSNPGTRSALAASSITADSKRSESAPGPLAADYSAADTRILLGRFGFLSRIYASDGYRSGSVGEEMRMVWGELERRIKAEGSA